MPLRNPFKPSLLLRGAARAAAAVAQAARIAARAIACYANDERGKRFRLADRVVAFTGSGFALILALAFGPGDTEKSDGLICLLVFSVVVFMLLVAVPPVSAQRVTRAAVRPRALPARILPARARWVPLPSLDRPTAFPFFGKRIADSGSQPAEQALGG